MPGSLGHTQLKSALWRAACALRGAVDGADYRGVILGAVFLKRLSDVADEGGELVFLAPEEARWSALRGVTARVGEAIDRACAQIERLNPELRGVLTNVRFADPRRLGPRPRRDEALRRLVASLDALPLGNRDLASPDVLGAAYEFLIGRFAEGAGRQSGEFYTPPSVVRLLCELLDPRDGMRVCDPTCGSGGMLIELARRAAKLTLHGQERNAATWSMARMNLIAHGHRGARVELGDTLRDPKLLSPKGLCLYDRIIANPPFSLRDWGRDEARGDRYGRFRYGLPPRARGDLAFVQHMLATLDGGGVIAVVLPQGALFRGGSEASIRRGLLDDDLVDAVIALPDGLFHGTPIPASALLLRRDRAPGEPVTMVSATSPAEHLTQPLITRITAAVRERTAEAGFSAQVPPRALGADDAVLSPSRHVGQALGEREAPDEALAAALSALSRTARERDEAEARLWSALAPRER